jgi:hypothetical protein
MRVRIQSSRVAYTCAALALAAAVSAVSADSPQQAPSGGSRFVVRAVGTAGPIADLKREELSIKTDGKQREVKTLELVNTASAPTAGPAAAAPARSTLPAPFATNAASPAAPAAGREFLIVLDDEGIGAGREEPVRKAVAQLMAAGSPADRFGIISLRVGGAAISPASDRQLVTGALDKFVGGGSSSESAGDMTCRAKRALNSLSEVLRGSPAGRVVVFISPGLPATQTNTQRMSGANQGQTTELCQIRSTDLEELSVAAALSPAAVYVLYYAEGLASPLNATAAQQGIENIAGVVNGEWMRLVEGNDRGMTRIAKETASYYIATLDDAPGAVRRIDARSTRDGVKLFVRPAGGARAAAPAAKVSSPRDMLRNATAFADLPLRAAGYLSREGGGMKVVTLFEPVAADAKLTAASVGVIDEKGTLKWQWSAQPADLARSPMAAAIPVPAGKYRVRVAAIDANGTNGAVDYELDATLADAPPLKMSTMLVGVSDKGFMPKLVFTPSDTMAVGLIELYGVPQGATVTSKFELAENETATPLGDTAGNVAAGPGEDARRAFGGFGIGTLAPGDYVMRATIMIDGKVVGKTTRTIRKTN